LVYFGLLLLLNLHMEHAIDIGLVWVRQSAGCPVHPAYFFF